jgi:hypothetical protein
MSERVHPGVHPDVDTLSAFVEGALPEHERTLCLAHLAECPRCREVVFSAQDIQVAPSAPVVVPRIVRGHWLTPVQLLTAAAAVCVMFFGAWVFQRSRTGPPPRELAAQVKREPSFAPDKAVETPAPKPDAPKPNPRASRIQQGPTPEAPATPPATLPETPRISPSPALAESKDTSRSTPVNTPPAPKSATVAEVQTASTVISSGISGTVTDPTGAVVPTANVQLRQLATNRTSTAQTDQSGEFKFTGLAPGQYELRISMAGFRQATQRVDVRPQEVAAVKSTLELGATTETVEVTAAASTIQTESAQVSTSRRKRAAPVEPRALPSKLPVEIMVTRDKVILAVDSAGVLFFSGNSGQGWKSVKPKWPGKIVDLVTPPELPKAGEAKFQLTTDSDTDWLSRDGRNWYPAPPQH